MESATIFAESSSFHRDAHPSMDRPALSGALPGAWDSYPPRGLAKNARVSFMEEMVCEFSVIMFESAHDENFTNPSALFPFFFISPRGEKNLLRRRRHLPNFAVSISRLAFSSLTHDLTSCWSFRYGPHVSFWKWCR